MRTTRYNPNLVQAAMATLGATLALVFLLVCLASSRSRAAPLPAGIGTDPHIRAIIATASLSISDSHSGSSLVYAIGEVSEASNLPPDGTYTSTARTLDQLGNARDYTDAWSLEIDTASPPTPTLLSPANGTVTRTSAITFVWSDTGAISYNLQINGTVFTTTTPYSAAVLADGTYSWTVQALGQADIVSGYSLRFYGHGVDDIDRVKIPIDPQVPVDVGGDFTLEFWMKAYPGDNNSGVCEAGEDNWITGNLIFDRDVFGRGDYGDYGVSLHGGQIAFGASSYSWGGAGICSTTILTDGQWHHVAVTRRSSGQMRIYVDGRQEAEETAGPDGDISYRDGRSTEYPNSDPFLVIGAEKHDYDKWIYPSYNGFIDEVRFSNVVRYTSDFVSPSAPFALDVNTIALYHLDEGPAGPCDGTVIQDSSDGSEVNDGPSDGFCKYGGSGTSGPIYSADTPFTGTEHMTLHGVALASGYTDTWTLEIDTIPPPTPTLLSPTDGTITNDTTITFSWSDESTGGAVSYTLDVSGSLYTVSQTSHILNLPSDGIYTWTVQALDLAGNASGYTDTLAVIVDSTLSTAVLEIPQSGTVLTVTHLPVLIITGTASDNGSGLARVEVTTGTVWATAAGTSTWAYTWTLPIIDKKVYTLTARATDNATNVGYSPDVTVTVDTVAPANPMVMTTTNGTATGVWTNTNTVPVSWTMVSDGSGVVYYYRWDQVPTTVVSESDALTTGTAVTGTDLAQGDNWFHLRVRDRAGNWAAETAHLGPFRVDTLPPSVTISTPTSGTVLTTTHLSTFVVTGTAADAGSDLAQVEVTTGTAWVLADGLAPWTYAWTLPITDSEIHTLVARATDNTTKVGYSPNVTVTVDTVPPTTAAPLPDRSPWVTSTVVYTWSPSSDGAGIAGYQVHITSTEDYNTVFSTSDPTLTFTQAYSEGTGYYARVQATDHNGNAGSWSSPSTVVIPDLTRPTISVPSIDESAEHFYVSGLTLFYTNTMSKANWFTVTGEAGDALSGLDKAAFSPALGQVPPDDGSPAVFAASYQISPGTTESGVITATLYDQVGHTAVQTYTYALDGTPPDSEASAPSHFTDLDKPFPVTWVATDTQSGVYSTTLWYMKEATGTWTRYQTVDAGSGTFGFLPSEGDGLYLFATVAADNLGNVEARPTVSETQTFYDTRVPQSKVTWAPQYRNSDPITMTWVATPSLASLAEVRLWYRFDGGTWYSTTIASAQASGVFTFTPPDGDGAYDFATVARNVLGRSEVNPHGKGDATTIYDTRIDPPSDLGVLPIDWTNVNAFSVAWNNPMDSSGIAGAYFKLDAAPAAPDDGTWVPGSDLEQIVGITVSGEGTHVLYIWLRDVAGNVNHNRGQTVTLRYDATRPTDVTITAPGHTSETRFLVSWSASDAASGVVSYTVEYSGTAYTGWQPWLSSTTMTSAMFTAPAADVDFVFRVTAYDRAGNNAHAYTTTKVGFYRTYLPLTIRQVRPVRLKSELPGC